MTRALIHVLELYTRYNVNEFINSRWCLQVYTRYRYSHTEMMISCCCATKMLAATVTYDEWLYVCWFFFHLLLAQLQNKNVK
ncbi:hypothetical protein DERF_000500 [Dermatophagoides farinae]|uniref:Uncharacterized protein n=1 Tax=Dermatophagoides farinae TaxID=6954 RepID=A0A922I6P4_DERFA|nr:hypothetical protein DERF_000500 [Dermatophagoides farinae]